MLRKKSIIILSTAIALDGLLVEAGMGARFAVADERAATSAAGEIKAGFTTLTSAQLAAMLRRKDFYFVNTHTLYEGERIPTRLSSSTRLRRISTGCRTKMKRSSCTARAAG